MVRNTKTCLIMGVIVMLSSVAFSFGGSVVMLVMALKSLDPNDANNVAGAVIWVDRAFWITAIGMAVAAIAFVFTLITLAWWFMSTAKTSEKNDPLVSGK